MKVKAKQGKKEENKNIQQVTQKNTILLTLVQEKQKKIDKLMMKTKILIDVVIKEKITKGALGNTTRERAQKSKKQKHWHKNSNGWVYHSTNKWLVLETNKDKHPQW